MSRGMVADVAVHEPVLAKATIRITTMKAPRSQNVWQTLPCIPGWSRHALWIRAINRLKLCAYQG